MSSTNEIKDNKEVELIISLMQGRPSIFRMGGGKGQG